MTDEHAVSCPHGTPACSDCWFEGMQAESQRRLDEEPEAIVAEAQAAIAASPEARRARAERAVREGLRAIDEAKRMRDWNDRYIRRAMGG